MSDENCAKSSHRMIPEYSNSPPQVPTMELKIRLFFLKSQRLHYHIQLWFAIIILILWRAMGKCWPLQEFGVGFSLGRDRGKSVVGSVSSKGSTLHSLKSVLLSLGFLLLLSWKKTPSHPPFPYSSL